MNLLKPVSLVVAAASVTACGTQAARDIPAAPAAVQARIAAAEAADLPAYVEAGGVVRAAAAASVASRVLAPVVEVAVSPGDHVKRGQPLVLLDGRELSANVSRAVAARAAAEQAIAAARAASEAADASRVLAETTHGRMANLRARGSATPQELDVAVANLRSAEAAAAGARARVDEAAAALDAAGASAEAARIAASYAVLTAPFDGVVTARWIDPGAMAAPGAPLLAIEDLGPRRLEVHVDETRAAVARAGGFAEVRLDDGGGEAGVADWTRGRIVEVARIDPETHSFLVKVELPAAAAAPTGAFGRARFAGPAREAITVPASAIVRRGQLTFAFVVDAEGAARLRPVRVGESLTDRVEVLAGVRAGDRVVAEPPPSLADGMRVAAPVAGSAR